MKAQQLGDWRTYYRRHPTLLLGLALGGGLALSAMARRRVIPPDNAGPTTSDRAFAPVGRTRRHVQDTWEIVSEVLLGMAAGKVMEFVGDVVPGFTDELNRRHAGSVGLPRSARGART